MSGAAPASATATAGTAAAGAASASIRLPAAPPDASNGSGSLGLQRDTAAASGAPEAPQWSLPESSLNAPTAAAAAATGAARGADGGGAAGPPTSTVVGVPALAAVRQAASELIGAGQWARCSALLEGVLFPGLPAGDAIPGGRGAAGGGAAAAGGVLEAQQPAGVAAEGGGERREAAAAATAVEVQGGLAREAVATSRTRKELLQLLVVAKVHQEAAALPLRQPSRSAAPPSSGNSTDGVGSECGAGGSAGKLEGTPESATAVLRWAATRFGAPPGPRRQDSSRTPTATTASGVSGTAAAGAGAAAGGGGGDDVAREPREVRSWFRRLAAFVHPDKCRTIVPDAAAASAFRLLQQGCDRLMGERLPYDDGRGGGGGGSRKRGRPWDTARRRSQSDGDGGGNGSGADDDEEFAWWSHWSCRPSPGPSYGGPGDGDGGDGGRPSTCPGQEDEEPLLWDMPLQDLEAEVAVRQAHVLRPPPGSDAAALPIHSRQCRLRVARSVLSQRSAAASSAAAAWSDAAGASGGWDGDGGGFVRGWGWG